MAPKFKTTKKRVNHAMGINISGISNYPISEHRQQQEQQQRSTTPPLPTPQPSQQHQHLHHHQQQQQQYQKSQHNGADLNRNVIDNTNIIRDKVDISNDSNQTTDHATPIQTSAPTLSTPKVSSLKSQSPVTPSPMPPPLPSTNRVTSSPHTSSQKKETYYSYKASPLASNFSWEIYLERRPAKVAPKEAFRQATNLPKNLFQPGMKLEAKDPRNSSNWCLATVIFAEGLHLRLRFVGADAMNDLYELIDSENIRPVGSSPSDLLLAPTGFTGNIAQYPKFVEKVLRDESTIIAPPEYFPPTPQRPKTNLFERGMKIEAVDLKNRDFICPATIGAVDGSKLLIVFDGWKGSFDYRCEYTSRDIFPINWCRDVGRAIQPPNGWNKILAGRPGPSWSPPITPDSSASRANLSNGNGKNASESSSQLQSPSKRPRGRPKKDIAKSQQNKISKEKLKPTRPMSSTPKKQQPSHQNHTQESFMTPSPQTPDDGVVIKPDLSDDVLSLNRFQCQRTVSYDDWQKRKIDDQMPQAEFLNGVGDGADAGLNLSDTTSMASTLSSTQRDSTELSDQGSSGHKRPRIDTREVSISEELRHLLETKPCKLSQWTVEDVVDVLKTESSLVKYAETFQENEIDGKAFGLFDQNKRDLLMSMGLKLGPVLKVLNLREQLTLHVDTSDIVLR